MTRSASILSGLLLLLTCAAAASANIEPPKEPPARKAAPAPAPAPPKAATTSATHPRALDWEELLPEKERNDYSAAPPPPAHDYLSGESGLAAQQTLNFSINTALAGQWVKIPGFIVPLEIDAQGKVTEFFLVPYYGACIHVPPPPPNQMVYVVLKQGVALDSLYAAFWVTGQLSARTKSTRLGVAAYSIAATSVEDYEY